MCVIDFENFPYLYFLLLRNFGKLQIHATRETAILAHFTNDAHRSSDWLLLLEIATRWASARASVQNTLLVYASIVCSIFGKFEKYLDIHEMI